ncbi:uncharacterized protein MYCFIDRAFT_83873 [Pseudocercospora fijiensis CIRAD86]|uniref:F-box domain-containing protein n=1 Tax=Pseudocercospora fijiensis (strain CIRAD86) TaxID=383855 RepID=M3A2V9_PSEFD|nr:uncharacterized protein MYCFIDRAFT_83873 [Pseudocercospora fijiensis CIRAD86]EME78771.1 hypothetical protein MYCFIDRAFT_83873 [Pseudocercospora fijiensis CIRAD86]
MATSMSDHAVAQLRATRATNEEVIRQLLASNAALDQIIADHEGTTTRLSSCRFLDLPPELRDQIYDICLSVGKVFLPPFLAGDVRLEGRREFEKPKWQLLLVSKKIREESAKRLFSCNLMVLSAALGSKDDTACNVWLIRVWSPFTHLRKWPLSFRHLKREFLTKVSIAFDMRCEDKLQSACLTKPVWTPNGTLARPHHDTLLQKTLTWKYMLHCSMGPALRHLQVDLTNCYCDSGCHRLTSTAAALLVHDNKDLPIKLEVIEILGTQTADERRELTGALGFEFTEDVNENELRFHRNDSGQSIDHGKLTMRFKAFKIPSNISSFRWSSHLNFYQHEDLGDEVIEYGPPTIRFKLEDPYSSWYERAPIDQPRPSKTGSSEVLVQL